MKSLLALGAAGVCLPTTLAAGEARKKPAKKKAKSVIFVFLAGGPSHTDTFDPKPAAGRSF